MTQMMTREEASRIIEAARALVAAGNAGEAYEGLLKNFHAVTSQPKAKARRDPESEFYDSLKRKDVVVTLTSGTELRGILAWVAVYTIGVDTGAGPVMLMKGAIASIGPGG